MPDKQQGLYFKKNNNDILSPILTFIVIVVKPTLNR